MAPRVPAPAEVLKFEGTRDYPIEQKIDDWGLAPDQQETYVELFRRRLVAENLYRPDEQDYFTLRRFLRARTYDLDKATIMFRDHVNWRDEHAVGTILQDFYFNERDKFLAAYPQGYHKLDKQGRPVYIQLIGKINVPAIMACTDEERMFKFHVQEYERCVKVIMPVCSRLAKRKVDQTFGIMDVKGVGLSALTGDVKRMLSKFTKTDQDNYPEMLGHICIINAPTIFRMVWSVVKGMIDIRTQQKIEILGSDYMPSLLKHMDKDCIPEFLGGTSKGTLLDDVGPWSNSELMADMGIDLEALRLGRPQPLLMAPSFGKPSAGRDGGAAPAAMAQAASMRGASVAARGVPEAAGNGAAAAGASLTQLTTIAEARSRALLERVRALEALLPPAQVEKQRAQGMSSHHGTSIRAAPEGSLLHRIEVVEDAVEALLFGHEALLSQVQQQAVELRSLKAAKARADQELAARASRPGCCTVM